MVCGVIGTKKRLVEDVTVEIQKHFFNSLLSHSFYDSFSSLYKWDGVVVYITRLF